MIWQPIAHTKVRFESAEEHFITVDIVHAVLIRVDDESRVVRHVRTSSLLRRSPRFLKNMEKIHFVIMAQYNVRAYLSEALETLPFECIYYIGRI
jgi:hypothetical protein